MHKAIILKNGTLFSALGDQAQTIDLLFKGQTGIVPGPCFGVDVPYAPFQDPSLRIFENAVNRLKFDIPKLSGKLLFIYSAAKGDLSDLENYYRKSDSAPIINALHNQQIYKIINLLGIQPAKAIALSSACASGSAAIDYAKEVLQQGMYSDVLIFGFDVISEFIVKGFYSLGALSAKNAKPFDKERNGLTLGDGAALVHLSYDYPHQGDTVIRGTGTSNDANHRTGPSRTGDGLFRAIRAAADDGKCAPQEIGAVKCHGTATNYNDAMEAKALFSFFNSSIPPCVSLKGAIGHTSGAGSLLEIILSASFLKKEYIPPTIGFESPGVDEPLLIKNTPQKITGNSILCLSAGFGGLNAAIIIEEIQ